MKILLICFSGMSTGILSFRMKEAAGNRGLLIEIQACPLSEIESYKEGIEAALVGPQLKYALSSIKNTLKDIPVICIDKVDYGIMNGEKVLCDLLDYLNNNH